MNLKEEMKRHDRPMEYDVFGKIIVENAVPTTIAIDVAESYAKEKDDEIQALKVRIEELEFELKRAEEHIDGTKSING